MQIPLPKATWDTTGYDQQVGSTHPTENGILVANDFDGQKFINTLGPVYNQFG